MEKIKTDVILPLLAVVPSVVFLIVLAIVCKTPPSDPKPTPHITWSDESRWEITTQGGEYDGKKFFIDLGFRNDGVLMWRMREEETYEE